MAEQSPSCESAENVQRPDKTASEAVAACLNDMVNKRDLQEIIESQDSILEHFEKSNETLSGVNALAAVRYEAINADFKKHIVMLLEMKKNLESVFKRIRVIKQNIKTTHPEAYEACYVEYIPPDDEEEETITQASTDIT